jgi:hypothetical protein
MRLSYLAYLSLQKYLERLGEKPLQGILLINPDYEL